MVFLSCKHTQKKNDRFLKFVKKACKALRPFRGDGIFLLKKFELLFREYHCSQADNYILCVWMLVPTPTYLSMFAIPSAYSDTLSQVNQTSSSEVLCSINFEVLIFFIPMSINWSFLL